jgi:hypothetical protein
MKSFLDKIEFKTDDLRFYLKYNVPIDIETDYFLFDYAKPKDYNRIDEIINCCDCLSIEARLLYLLPNNFNKKHFRLCIWDYNGEKLPENWNINEVNFSDFLCDPIINDDFKYNVIHKRKK